MQSKQRKQPGSPLPKMLKWVHSVGKAMALIFWDNQGKIMIDYLEQGCMLNGAYYTGKLRRLCQKIASKWRETLTGGVLTWNTFANTSQIAMTAATECGFKILPHPTYPPDTAPFDFHLFPKLKFHLSGTRTVTMEAMRAS